MYIQEISIGINAKVDQDEMVDEFELLLSYYRSSGQKQGRIETSYVADNKITGLPFTLEKNSLNRKNNNFYVNQQIKKLENLCSAKLQIKTIGKSYKSYKSSCTCTKSDLYILITNYVTIESPISCGNCNKSIPLYKLPKYYDFGYMPILSWETNYISCDNLQMNCEVGERWALNQMQDLTSTLTKQGLKICGILESLTNIPTYYYLYNYTKNKGVDLRILCPGCNDNWGLIERLHNIYDYKCERCKLISTVSPNT